MMMSILLISLKKKLEEMLAIERQDNISIRTILSYFIRYKKSSFIDPIITNKYTSVNKPDYSSLVNVFYLLNLDTKLLKEKQKNHKKLDSAKNAKRSLEDKEIKSLLNSNNTNIDIEMNILSKKLEEKLKLRELYKVSDTYADLKSELYNKRNALNETTNCIEIIKSNLKKIALSLEEKHDITVEEIKKFYGDVYNIFPSDIIRELKEVEEFHNNLIKNRINRLSNSRIELMTKLKNKEQDKKLIEKRIDELYSILGSMVSSLSMIL